MAMTFVPGYAVNITIGGDTVIGLTANQYDLDDGYRPLVKSTFGAAHDTAISGQATGTFNMSGHATAEALPLLNAIRTAPAPIAVEITYDAAGNKVGFSAAGVSVSESASADGEVDWAITGQLSTAVTFTAGT